MNTVQASDRSSKFAYGVAAFLVSCVWIATIALATAGLGASPGILGMWTNYQGADWRAFAPFMLAAGVVGAFLFRSWIRASNVYTFAPLSILFGLAVSWFSAWIPGLVFYSWMGPIIFIQLWPITVPLSVFSMAVMRSVDRGLRRHHA